MEIKTRTEFEEFGYQGARIWVIVDVDGAETRYAHVYGPRDEVRLYFEGKLLIGKHLTRIRVYVDYKAQKGREGREFYQQSPLMPPYEVHLVGGG